MKREDYKIHIVGAGVSGLIAAKTLEQQGYRPIILEASDRVGGRVKTDCVEGFQLDHGFQVLLDAYPLAKKHLDFQALELQTFRPGAVIFKDSRMQTIGDPIRDLSLLMPTMLANIGNFSDKLKILKLNNALKKKSISSIFSSEETSTLDYLVSKGFSNDIIHNFFKPFFSGIFLEPNLTTSSRMFEFVYKMFGEGHAVLPKSGIEAIPKQLKAQLEHTDFSFNTKIKSVHDDHLVTYEGKRIATHFTIIATEAHHLVSNLNTANTWKSCDNLYFKTTSRNITKPLIGLIAEDNALINNIFFHNSLETDQTAYGELLSVTVVKTHELDENELIKQVQKDLEMYCNISNTTFLKRYKIPMALPELSEMQNDCSPTETQLKPTIYLAGDQLLNGSLNAAMRSGERAAEGLILALEDGLRIEEITSEYL
ncbi:Flavin containing amine oxidoreductase [Formosa sp. Hel1_31_208]|uniref:FAD-dependent oxidoreductase n=1 Tax=Formosa sp. Hel1_31_208 TaxID=1798225 RepID=UPI00087AEDE2|nr:FAD-dependent oxidoreductase [Formosa sp. Hel1_31_208]SDS33769.1 Flavin containing amine oxidoreductase [Formosa sp. Hel1_31_208]